MSAAKAAGATTASLALATGWPATVHFIIYSVSVTGALVAGSVTLWKATLSGTTLSNMQLESGTEPAAGYAIGAVVEPMFTSAHLDELITALLLFFDQDGTPKAGAIDNAAALASNIVTTAKILNANVTPDKLATGAQVATVATSQTTSSTSYADLATTGPAATATIGANGLALVAITVSGGVSTATGEGWRVGFAVSGATTVAAADARSLGVLQQDAANNQVRFSAVFLVTGLTAGSNVFTLKYKALGTTTGTFADRTISVVPL